MKLSRRSLLMTGGFALPVTYFAKDLIAAPSDTKNVILLLSGIDASLPPALLAQIIAVFVGRFLPVSCAVDFVNATSAAETVNDIAKKEPGLIEVLATIPEIVAEARYFQARAASDLRKSVVEQFFAGTLEATRYPVVSLYNSQHGAAFDFPAFRSAGFRTQLVPAPTSQPTELQIVGREQLQITGGIRIDLAGPTPWRLTELRENLEREGDILISLNVSGAENLAESEILKRCALLAATLRAEVVKGRVFATRPVDLLLHASQQPAPSTAILLQPSTDASSDAFVQNLQANDIPFTMLDNENDSIVALLTPDTTDSWTGLRDDGRFQIATHGTAGMSADDLLPDSVITDSAVIIHPETITTNLQRATLIDRLVTMRREGKLRLHDVTTFTNHVLAPDPIFARFQSVRSRKVSDPEQPQTLTDEARTALLDDARLAWRYIERFTNPTTGVCAGTVQGGANLQVNQKLTMWDLASQVQGIIAAHTLEIIPTEDARNRLAKLLANLPSGTVDGLKLPPLFFSASTLRTTTTGFDMCDTGRFFTALTSAINASLVSRESGQEVLAKWNLSETIKDTHPFNYSSGTWSDSYLSHCTPYTSRGMSDWDVKVQSPYPEADSGSADERMRLLYRVAFIGHYGTEPMLLEGLELGETPASKYLSDILFDAQLSAYERTGILKCASETLLNFSPWFSYQGIRLDRPEAEGWVVSSAGSSASFQTEAFHAKSEVISSKSAYLWAASYPHPHSQRMLEFIREKARVEGFGFAAGVFTQTQEVMESYGDINTNGIILTAIAKMLETA